MTDIIKKRPGTAGQGQAYENLNIANIVLKMVIEDDLDNFTLSSDDDNFGDFDDIVFETKFGKNEKTYALQLKYQNDGRRLTTANFTESGDFSIQKYFQSYKKISPLSKSHKLILFTNRKFDGWDGKNIPFDIQGFSVTISQVDVDLLINTSKAGICYQFINIRNNTDKFLSEEQKEYKIFFKNFYLYTNQANVSQLEASVEKLFQETFCCSDDEFSRYQKFITKWIKPDTKRKKLKKPQMKHVIALCVVSSFIEPLIFVPVNDNLKYLQEAISTFDITVFETKSYTHVSRIWEEKRSILENNLQQVNELRTRHQLNFNYVKNISDLNEENCTKLLWLMGVSPLIVVENKSTIEAIRICKNEKFILLGKGEIEDLPKTHSVFRNLSDLDPESEIYKNITTACKYSIQEKTEFNLQSLIAENKDFQKMVTTDDLLDMLEQTCVIGGGRATLPVPYIDRYLSRNIIDFKFLKTIDQKTLVVIDNMKQDNDVRHRTRSFNLIGIDDCLRKNNRSVDQIDKNADSVDFTFGADLYVSENKCSNENFEKICEINRKAERKHHFSLTEDGNLEWVQSLSDIDDLRPFCTEQGFIEEARLCSNRNNINLIIGDPGMGKSVLMNNLKNNVCAKFWTVIFYTEDIISLFKHLESSNFEDFVLSVKYARVKRFEKKVLKLLMQNNKVLYIWDAIDEISSENVEKINDIILELSKKKIKQWITCRCHLKNSLEKRLKVFSNKIIQFTDEQQSLYIHERLINNGRIGIADDTKIIKKLIVSNNILGIPLQVFMLTELFLKDPEKYSNPSKDTFNVTDLYEYFVDEKLRIYYKEKRKSSFKSHQDIRIFKDHKTDGWIKNYQIAALKALVRDVMNIITITESDKFLNKIQQNSDPVGIITEVTDDNIPHFIHNSFAEYFVATYFNEYHKGYDNFQDIIFGETQRNIRFFFDLLLAKNSKAHIAVLYKNIDSLREIGNKLKDSKDVENRNVLHLACSWGQTYPIFPVDNENETYIIDNCKENAYSVSAEDPKYAEMLHYLLDKCDVSEYDDLFNFDSLSYAETTNSFFAKAIILKRLNKKFVKFSDDDGSMASVLYYSAKFGYPDAIELISLYEEFPFIKMKADNCTYLHHSVCQENYVLQLLKIDKYRRAVNAVDGYGQTALSRACKQGPDTVVKHLHTNGASINIASNNGSTPLYYACQFGQTQVVRYLINFDTNIDARNVEGCTALHVACHNGHSEIVRMLLNHGAIPILADNVGRTPLHFACVGGHDTIIQLLIDQEVDVNTSQGTSWTPLLSACHYGHDKAVELLLEFKAEVNDTMQNGRTSLHYASEKGFIRIVQLLCRHGANVNAIDYENLTPLYLACKNGHYGVVNLLIKAGSDMNIRGGAEWTPLHVASFRGQHKVVQVLITHQVEGDVATETGQTPLHYASQSGHDETVELLLKHGSSVNAVDNNGLTPLHWSCKQEKTRVAKTLIDWDADINAIAINGKRPLHYACQYVHYDTVQLLLNFKATVNVPNDKGVTPFHLACNNGHEKTVELLMSRADINIKNNEGWSPLHYASHFGHTKIVQMLQEKGAIINASTNIGWTPLYAACQRGHAESARLLIKSGANTEARTIKGRTPLHTACENRHNKIILVLVDAKANIDSRDDEDWTPLHLACYCKYTDIIDLLITCRARINAITKIRWTPLHLTCAHGYDQICEHLLKQGKINLEALDAENRTPFYLACQSGHKNIVNLLMTKVNMYAAANDGSTPLHAACSNGHEQIVQLLIENMKIDVLDFNNCTPLHYACDSGYDKIVELLLQKSTANINAVGDNVNVTTAPSWTPLYFACANGHDQVVQVLIKHNVDVNVCDKHETTPLHVACQNGHLAVVEMLLKAGANVKVSTSYGFTPLYFASKGNHQQVVELLKRYYRCCCCIVMW